MEHLPLDDALGLPPVAEVDLPVTDLIVADLGLGLVQDLGVLVAHLGLAVDQDRGKELRILKRCLSVFKHF